MEFQTHDELFEKSNVLLTEAQKIVGDPQATTEKVVEAAKMVEDAKELKRRCKLMQELEALKSQAAGQLPGVERKEAGKFGTFGEMLCAVYDATFKHMPDPRLLFKSFDGQAGNTTKSGWATEKKEQKDLLENTGASGGFLVFPEHLNQLMMMSPLLKLVYEKATKIPMAARVVQIPVLDQTATTTACHYYGGVIPHWIEEAGYKDEVQPGFRQMELVAHELVLYTEASDTLLADSAIALEGLLASLYAGAIANEEEFTFIQGTGAGQPLGIANVACGATIAVPRAVAGAIGLVDIFNMLRNFQGNTPIWLVHQSGMPQILQLNGPAGNPSYVWIGNGRDQMPTTLMGYPIYFIENCPTLGLRGDICLCDWSKYLIGDRQGTTIDSSKHYRFRYDLTAWRAVRRVDGRPWLSAPITYRDGATQVSPFVVLDAVVAT